MASEKQQAKVINAKRSCWQTHSPLSLIVTYLDQTHLLSRRLGHGVMMTTRCGRTWDMRPGGCCLMDLQALAAGYFWKQQILPDSEPLSPFRDWVTVPCGGQAPVQRAQVPSGKQRPRTAEWGAFTGVVVASISLSFGLLGCEWAPTRGGSPQGWRGHPPPCSHPGFRRVHFLHKMWLRHSGHRVLWE